MGLPSMRCFSVVPSRHSMTMNSRVLVFADVVDGADVGMIQRRRRARFPLKTLARLRILGQLFGKELQGHAAAEALIFRLVNHAHSAAAQLSYNAVMGDCLVEHVALNVRLWIEASQFPRGVG